jgi:creatinine amidohydrolase/Fe(II)-dependent formamide hydrolase-like protein
MVKKIKDLDSYPLAHLQVFDKLVVGPVTVEPKRLIAPYTVHQKGKKDTIELIYTYEENVFDPSDEVTQNLANMIAVQTAINYGLFCKKITFHGYFDEVDKRFINDMAENTAREIFVKKLLEPNPFLVGEAQDLNPVKMKRYMNAELEFPEIPDKKHQTSWQFWSTSHDRYAVMSSGGKDSLLSYGLIQEIGHEVHPIFINESGRHWFTALNAYRYFSENVPSTSRVWTNADRVYNWMLNHMPFIRKDFSKIRSDEYPVRLWTVAVFIFGALPLLRKRGIGRLVIGDEFDTSHRTSYKGITHYDGLYDQSKYFDNALTRYYLRKGWAVSQFSILRQLSEMLIEKILVERYPKLQEHQVSCHATHKDGKQVKPCGNCEKCRRIIGLLKVINADPTRCGYNSKQIQTCLKSITKEGVHQESVGVQQLLFMLDKKGLIDLPPNKKKALVERPEIIKLRFDPERSPMTGIPTNIRKPLYQIFLEHSEGSIRRVGRDWVEFDPLTDPEIIQQYAFELDTSSQFKIRRVSADEPGIKHFLWGELTWPEAEERFKEVDIALLPVGSIEQHGPHLPMDTDAVDAEYLARQVAEACSDPKPLVLPLIPYGVSYEHSDFKGTIGVSNNSLAQLVYDIGISVAKCGINKLIIINGHGGNTPALNYAAQMINRDARIFICVDSGETSDVDIYKIIETPNDIHAGEIETSTSWAIRPHLVRTDKVSKHIPRFKSGYMDLTSKRFVTWYGHTKKISKTGVIGDPTKASAEKGEKIWQIMIAHLVSLVEELKRMTLNDIYQQKY